MYNESAVELNTMRDARPSLEQLREMKAKIRQTRKHMTGSGNDGQEAKMERNEFGHKYVGHNPRENSDISINLKNGAQRYDSNDLINADALPTPTNPRLSSQDLAPSTFNKFQSALRQAAVVSMLKSVRQLTIDRRLRKIREKEEAAERHEAAVRRHKNALRLQMARGQELEGVQHLALDFEDAARLNCDEDQRLTESIMSLMSRSPPRGGEEPPRHNVPPRYQQ